MPPGRAFRLAALCSALLAATSASAQRGPTFSIDFQGPSIGSVDFFAGGLVSEGDILTKGFPGPPGPNSPLAVATAPGSAIPVGLLGIVPGPAGTVEVDALSYGRDIGSQLVFSVDEFATGVPGAFLDVFTEGSTGAVEASADTFAFLSVFVGPPPAPVQVVTDGNGVVPSGAPGLGLVEPNPPTPGALPDPGDNLDALDVDTGVADLGGPVFFSLDAGFADPNEVAPANGGTAAANGFSGADVLVCAPLPCAAPALAIPAAALGLDGFGADTDDLDALAFHDADASLTLTAGDVVLFSLRRGSATVLAGVADSCFGTPIEEGDVLAPSTAFGLPAGLPPCIFIPGEGLGLANFRTGTAGPLGSDDLDALDLRGRLTFSVDFQGPLPLDAFFGVPLGAGDLLTQSQVLAPPGGFAIAPPGPNGTLSGPGLVAPGLEIAGIAGGAGVVPGGLGLGPSASGVIEVDAFSYGKDRGTHLVFSVDEFATGSVPSAGVFPPDVATEGPLGSVEASADVFGYLGLQQPTPPVPIPVAPGNTARVDGDGIVPSGLAGLGLAEPNAPSVGLLPDAGQNLDALDADSETVDLSGRVFFSLDAAFPDPMEALPANSGTAVANGFSGADVLVSFAGGVPAVAIPAAALGLDSFGADTDDIDALLFDDFDGSSTLTSPDTLLFSLRRGSLSITGGLADSCTGNAIEEGDVLAPASQLGFPPGSPPCIFVSAEALDLGTLRSGTAGPFGPDDLDALDSILLPEPGAPSLLAAGASLLAALARRRRARR